MKLKKNLKAVFFHKEEPVELNLTAAEIREGKAYLHPKSEAGVTYLVCSDNIEISLSKGFSLLPEHIVKIEPKGKLKKAAEESITKTSRKKDSSDTIQRKTGSLAIENDEFVKYKKRKFVVSLYPDEYNSVMASMKEYGYKRADFVLACVNTATKGTMEREHKKIVKAHTVLRKEEKALLNKQHQVVS